MRDLFARILTDYRKELGITQKQMMDILYQQSSLASLDIGTLSRWERGKTVPSFEKKLFILSVINKMEEYFCVRSIYGVYSCGVVDRVLNKRYGKVVNLATMFKTEQVQQDYKLNFSTFNDTPKEVLGYFSNRNRFAGQICDQINAQLGYWEENNQIFGFFIHAPIKTEMLSILSGHIDDMVNQVKFESSPPSQCDALFLFDQINLTQECFELSNLRLFLLLLANPQYKQLYICIHDQMYLNLMLRLGAEVVCTYQTEEMKENGMEHSQLVVFDSLKFISNKFVFEFFANVYNKLNRNNPDLLKQLRESNETRSNRFKAYC
ncbi:TPA: helix-turn-helix domain-containing protein [Photobacterium damselae]